MDKQEKIKMNREKHRKQEKTIIIVMSIVLVIAIVASVLLTRPSKDSSQEVQNQETPNTEVSGQEVQGLEIPELEGLWIHDSTTSYEFASDHTGILHVSEDAYHFEFTVNENSIQIDFADERVLDCEYGVSFENGYLYLEGREGTTGGIYELEKKEF